MNLHIAKFGQLTGRQDATVGWLAHLASAAKEHRL